MAGNNSGVVSFLVVAVLAVAFGSILIAGCIGGFNASSDTGRTIFTISDAAVNMGAVTSVKITVDSVQAHSIANGWTTVSSSAKTYDLLALKASGEQVLLADAQLKEGTYEEVLLLISKVVVTDAKGDHDAKLPSNELKIFGNFTVKANTTSTVAFDFVADESLHLTGNGVYIMAPVIHFETRERANVSFERGDRWDRVRIYGGNVGWSSARFGMDVDGNFGVDRAIPANANLTIEPDGKVKLHGGERP